ncbi:MAG TPA: Hsp20/alpha crystallin family protein [Paenalcaligenes sp.]|nr:Hsp20/alpha crystallin family protein [Paenalcaligenes sp.]
MSNFPITHRLVNDLFNDLTDGFFVKPMQGQSLPRSIAMDIKEDENAYVVHAELPGVKKDDIHVEIEGGLVTIKAEVTQEETTENERMLRRERYTGSVSRRFELPVEVDLDQANADYTDGILVLNLPKLEHKSNVRKLDIK